MKIRMDFVTNSSSSSFVTVTVVNETESAEEHFAFDATDQVIARTNEWWVNDKPLPCPSSGSEILQTMERFFRYGMTTGEAIQKSKRIKDFGSIDCGAVEVIQDIYHNGDFDIQRRLDYCIKGGKAIPCSWSLVWELRGLAELINCPIESEVVFSKVKDIDSVNRIVEQLAAGQLLDIGYNGKELVFNGKTLGQVKQELQLSGCGSYAKAEIIEVVPVSKRRKGSKFPAMKVRIIPMYTVEEYIGKKTGK